MSNGNCKISARVRIADPAFDAMNEVVKESGCPPKRGGMELEDLTSSLFVFKIGKIFKGSELEAIRQFTRQPTDEYKRFLQLLPEAMMVPT